MDPRFSLQAVAHVPAYYWPWVWWQLFWLRLWCDSARREVLYEIQPDGRVVTFLISDDKTDLRAWMYQQRQVYREHWKPMHNASGEMHLGAYHYWMGRIMECGARFRTWVRKIVARAKPAFIDSS